MSRLPSGEKRGRSSWLRVGFRRREFTAARRHDPQMRNFRICLEIDVFAIERDPFSIGRRHRRTDAFQLHHVFEGEWMFAGGDIAPWCLRDSAGNEDKKHRETLKCHHECDSEPGRKQRNFLLCSPKVERARDRRKLIIVFDLRAKCLPRHFDAQSFDALKLIVRPFFQLAEGSSLQCRKIRRNRGQ